MIKPVGEYVIIEVAKDNDDTLFTDKLPTVHATVIAVSPQLTTPIKAGDEVIVICKIINHSTKQFITNENILAYLCPK